MPSRSLHVVPMLMVLFACGAFGALTGCGQETDKPAVSAADSEADRAAASLVSVNAPAETSGDWFQFRGPSANGSSAANDVPLTWSGTENIAWKTPLKGAGASSPIVYRDRVYLTAYSGYAVPGESGGSLDRLQRHLFAIKLQDGTVLWEKSFAAKQPEEEHIRDHGYAANTPIADEDGVYVFFGKSGVMAFDHEGDLRWEASVGTQTNGWGTSASPVLYKDLVIVNASVESGDLVALDRKTGDEKWRAKGINEAWNTPVIAAASSGKDEVVVATHGKILAFEPETGKPLWSCNTEITWYMVPSPVVENGVIYYLGGRSGVAGLAIELGGTGDVTRTHRMWTIDRGSNVSSPVLHEDHLYWMNDQRGVAYCAKADTGEVLYEQRLDRAGQVYSSALLAAGRVYYLTRDGKTFVVKASPEFEQLAVNDLRDGSGFNGSPAVAGNRLLIRSDKFLYCIGK